MPRRRRCITTAVRSSPADGRGRDVTITTELVDTFSIARLLRLIASGRLDPTLPTTHSFALADAMTACNTFADTAGALKVVLYGPESASRPVGVVGVDGYPAGLDWDALRRDQRCLRRWT